MASNQTLERVTKFAELGYRLNFVPVRVRRESCISFEILRSKKYIALTCFSITVMLVIAVVFTKELVLNIQSIDIDHIIFTLSLIVLAMGVSGIQIWGVSNLESIVSLINTFLGFNQHLARVHKRNLEVRKDGLEIILLLLFLSSIFAVAFMSCAMTFLFYLRHKYFLPMMANDWMSNTVILLSSGLAVVVNGQITTLIICAIAIYVNSTTIWLRYLGWNPKRGEAGVKEAIRFSYRHQVMNQFANQIFNKPAAVFYFLDVGVIITCTYSLIRLTSTLHLLILFWMMIVLAVATGMPVFTYKKAICIRILS